MWRIPLSELNFDHRESEAVQQVLDSGWLTMGPRTEALEKAFADHRKAAYAVAVANCTCALELVYRFIFSHTPERKTVVVPDLTFVATANAVISAGGTPLLCDIDSPDRPCLSPYALENLLQSRTDIGAVVLVHYAGYDAGAETIAALCARYDVKLIEDCAHSPGGTTASGRPLGTVGLAGCFSFFSNKNLATGEGGMIVTSDQALQQWTKLARSHGVTGSTWTRHETKSAGYDVMFPGHNYRCTEITAALGMVQLQKLAEGNRRRQDLTRYYMELLESINGVKVALANSDLISHSDCHILPILFDDVGRRHKCIEALSQAQIQTSHHYRPIHTFSWYSQKPELAPVTLHNADSFANREVTLPLHPKLTEQEVSDICDIVRRSLA